MTLQPAYGRDYPNKEAVVRAFNQNKDFMTVSGSYTSKQELVKLGISRVTIRYSKLTKAIIYEL